MHRIDVSQVDQISSRQSEKKGMSMKVRKAKLIAAISNAKGMRIELHNHAKHPQYAKALSEADNMIECLEWALRQVEDWETFDKRQKQNMNEETTVGQKIIQRLDHAVRNFDALDKRLRKKPLEYLVSQELHQCCGECLAVVFDTNASDEERNAARMSIVEAIAPEILYKSMLFDDALPKLSDLVGLFKDNPIDVAGDW